MAEILELLDATRGSKHAERLCRTVLPLCLAEAGDSAAAKTLLPSQDPSEPIERAYVLSARARTGDSNAAIRLQTFLSTATSPQPGTRKAVLQIAARSGVEPRALARAWLSYPELNFEWVLRARLELAALGAHADLDAIAEEELRRVGDARPRQDLAPVLQVRSAGSSGSSSKELVAAARRVLFETISDLADWRTAKPHVSPEEFKSAARLVSRDLLEEARCELAEGSASGDRRELALLGWAIVDENLDPEIRRTDVPKALSLLPGSGGHDDPRRRAAKRWLHAAAEVSDRANVHELVADFVRWVEIPAIGPYFKSETLGACIDALESAERVPAIALAKRIFQIVESVHSDSDGDTSFLFDVLRRALRRPSRIDPGIREEARASATRVLAMDSGNSRRFWTPFYRRALEIDALPDDPTELSPELAASLLTRLRDGLVRDDLKDAIDQVIPILSSGNADVRAKLITFVAEIVEANSFFRGATGLALLDRTATALRSVG